jgi:hypothetical protein
LFATRIIGSGDGEELPLSLKLKVPFEEAVEEVDDPLLLLVVE